MMDKTEQTRRLAQFIAEWCGPLSSNGERWAHVTDRFIEGALDAIAEPAPPTLPVVSAEAVEALLKVRARMPLTTEGWAECLRAAFPIMLPDNLNALPRESYMGNECVFFPRSGGIHWHLPTEMFPDLIRALGGAA